MTSINNILKISIFTLLALIFAMMITSTPALAFGESGGSGSGSGGDSGCCHTPPPTYNPPVYNPPSYNPPTENPPQSNPAAKCISFTADRTTVPHTGGTVKLSWSTQNASSVTISGVGSGLPANKTNHSVTVNSNTTFTLTAIGAGGNDSHCKVTIKVENPPADPVKCLYLTANKTVVNKGETVRLSWATQNATQATINNGVGNVTPVSSGYTDVVVNNDITYTMTVTGAAGSHSCNVSITTKSVQVNSPRCDYFQASDTRNLKIGDRITLSWNTTNANDVRIEPRPGSVSEDGSTTVTIYDRRTTFTLHARNLQNNQEATCTVTVYADDEKENEPTPRCELEISKKRVNRGEKVTLSWETRNADEIRIRDDRGNTIYETSSRRYLSGEIDVVINRSTEFTMTARGEGGSRTCRVDVVVDDLEVYEKRDQGYVIALTQVPYTGFEAGPFLTFLFYAMLTLWALFISYVLVIKKGSILGFSLYGNNGAAVEADIENRKKVEALVAKYSGLHQNK